ncbi:MAG: bacillithiol biosynthesis cysteine-adding enzyme BshC [Flavobacteriaceae bacterium]
MKSRALHIPIEKTSYFSPLMKDYKMAKNGLSSFYHRKPVEESFLDQIQEKQTSYSKKTRENLVKSLRSQYAQSSLSTLTAKNIDDLALEYSFTITTGHQLNVFTGPFYFWHKIINVIELCKDLKKKYPAYNFVPVYWMASEDHDFEEINFFNFKGHKLRWDHLSGSHVGALDLEGMQEVFESFSKLLGGTTNADELRNLFKESYLKHDNLADAMRYLVNTLFGDQGLVIIDGNDSRLKSEFVPYMKEDLFENTSFNEVEKTNAALGTEYKIQVNPRPINLFYLSSSLRTRIEEVNDGFKLVDLNISWTKEELLAELEEFPERFSPNVVLRPLYQEVVLPNLAYIGGGGEMAYWFELKSMFDRYNVTFPILLLRNSVLIMTEKQWDKLGRLQVGLEELFLKKETLINKKVSDYSEEELSFETEKNLIKNQFENLYKLAERTDASFVGAVAAQERKQIKGLEHLEKRLLKAEKRRLYDRLTRVEALQEALFPTGGLEERIRNFSYYYERYGKELMEVIAEHMNPLAMEFLVLVLED